MGKSKFPGKPSKSVMKERVRVLHKNENLRDANVSPRQTIKKNRKWTCSDSSIRSAILLEGSNNALEGNSESKTIPTSQDEVRIGAESCSSGKDHFEKICPSRIEDEERQMDTAAAGSQPSPRDCYGLNLNYSSADLEKLIKKKTVTFKNSPETSDDTSKKVKIHNQLKGPLISIMKKECTSTQRYVLRGNSIVRPSRLTEILRHSENIDKTNSLSFRTIQISNALQQRNLEDTKPSKNENFVKDFLNNIITNDETQLQGTRNCKSLHECKPRKSEELADDIQRNLLKKRDVAAPNKTILREPRLYFEPQNKVLPEGNPDSSATDLSSPLPCIHSACGVCNSTIYNKATQNQKYGIAACDACRKFISKITKKTLSSSTSPLATFKIQCNKKDGQCVISCPTRNTVKSFKKIYDERCSACWLKKCINTFHFSSGHKLRLNAILSETQKLKSQGKSKSCLSMSRLVTNCKSKISTMGYNQRSFKTTERSWPIKLSHSPDRVNDNNTDLTMGIWLQSNSCQPKEISDDSVVAANSKLNPNLATSNKTDAIVYSNSELLSTNFEFLSNYPKRQKIDFKGPRVKHVCRSASIALGQRIARFSSVDESDFNLSETNLDTESSLLNKPLYTDIYFSNNVNGDVTELRNHLEVGENELQQFNMPLSKSLTVSTDFGIETKFDENVIAKSDNNYQFQKPKQKSIGNRKAFMVTRHGLDSLTRRNILRISKGRNFEQKSKLISIEFCDNYIPAEVNETGFGIILTESFPIFALCFLCGSMDLENLNFCASCCEPYHSYCIQEGGIREKNKYIDGEKVENILQKLNWVCPRCTVCYTCNMSSGSKIKCQKCKKNYHSTCMGTSKGLMGADRPLICRSCLKCQTCSTTKVSKYVDRQPICTQCFKMSQSESRCPRCNNTFDDTLDIIILKCDICKKFIHAKCEGLTEVQSNLQRNLPENIPFACKKCSFESDYAKNLAHKWREAVIEELKCGLLDTLKLLSRSRQANILKRAKNNYICDFTRRCNGYSNHGGEEENSVNIRNRFLNCMHESSNSYGSDVNKPLSLYDIRKKVIDKQYITLFDFNADMNDVILPLKNDELILTYKEILSEKFSWFQNETKTCTDALEEDMFESNNTFPMDDIVTEDLNTTLKLPEATSQIVYNLDAKNDNRPCILCKKKGDGDYLQESRLLYCGFNTWVHANCIIWSNGAYEEFDGTIQNVSHVLKYGLLTRCAYCNLLGATIGCSFDECCNFFHFVCAIKTACIFGSNRLVQCSNHISKYADSNMVKNKTKFEVCRPLYVDLDTTLVQKNVEPCNVKFMVGSLAVVQLGKVYPKFSDTSEAIVPINFICTRLYWSCKEPWKIVKYNVQTSIQNFSFELDHDVGKHFTVDHSQNSNLVEKQLSEIANWQNALIREKNVDPTLHQQFGNLPFSDNNFNETNSGDFIEEEPQSNSDLLPPEIKDVIFEDLPHDILDGISMLDIFPKLMIYEDILPVDAKAGTSFGNDPWDNSALQSSAAGMTYNMLNKHESNAVNHLEENTTINLHSTYHKRELQTPHSDGLLRKVEGCRNKQRLPSVTLISKFDDPRGYLPKRFTEKCRNDIQSCSGKLIKNDNCSDKCRGNHKKQKIKLIQLDGTDDIFLDHLSSQKKMFSCNRCHCTYRTLDLFQRHLLNCTNIFTTESEKFQINVNSSSIALDDFLKNNANNQNNLNGNQETTNLTVIAKSSLTSTHALPQDNLISSNYYGGFFIDSNIGNGTKSYTTENVDECCDESGCENDIGIEYGSLVKDKKKTCNIHNTNKKVRTEQCNDNSNSKLDSVINMESRYSTPNRIEYTSPVKYNHLQFLNQPLLLSNQFTQKEEQTQQQQLFVLQQSNSQPLFIHQLSNTQTIPQNIFPVVHYTSMQPSPNALMQGSIFPPDAGGNIIISSGLQMLSIPSIQLSTQSSPQLVGGFNQPPSLHLSQNQMFIGGSSTLDLLPNSNQVLLTTSPMYYGLETIVQNTVMSSQQFVSTAMQGVLSSNASFSATTTQVFQSSKFEPVNETQSNYVVLNNSDGTAIMVPQTNVLAGIMNTSSDYQSAYSHDFGNVCSTHQQTLAQEPHSNNILPLISTLSDMPSVVIKNPISPIHPTLNIENNSHITATRNEFTSSINDSFSKISTNTAKNNNTVEKNFNSIPKLKQKIIKRTKINKLNQSNFIPDSTNVLKNSARSMQCKDKSIRFDSEKKTERVDKIGESNKSSILTCASTKSANNCQHYIQQENNQNEHISDVPRIPYDEKNDKKVLQTANSKSLSQLYSITSSKLPHTSSSFGGSSNTVRTNKVAPISHMQQNNIPPARPTNRVLPMQSVCKKAIQVEKNSVDKFLNNSSSETDEGSTKKICEDLNDNVQQKFALATFINENIAKDPDIYLNGENGEIQSDSNKYERTVLCKSNVDESDSKNILYKSKFKEIDKISGKGNTFVPMDYPSPNCKLSVTDDIGSSSEKCLSTTDIPQHRLESTKPKDKREMNHEEEGKEPHLIYEIQSEDGFSYKSESIADIWETVFEAVQSARRVYGLSSLPIEPFAEMCGVQMIGLKTNALKYLVEQLPGTERCTKYTPKYHKHSPENVAKEKCQQEQEKLFENVHGAIRCEPFSKKSQYDIFSWLASKHRKQPKQIFLQPLDTELIARRCNTNLPMAMKYRTLKETCKQSVGVFRSLIHGRGLFCTKDIEAGEMVIEYSGELIRSTLTDKRERFYDSKGIGCYMFKIDENFVVDATMRGNAARFINHSCEPNCYSRVVDILGHKHIIIFSLRRIVQGEELTYDYKFPFEDVKIPCSCGSRKCRRYLN